MNTNENAARILDAASASVAVEPLDVGSCKVDFPEDSNAAPDSEQGLLNALHEVASDLVMDAAILRAGRNAQEGAAAHLDADALAGFRADLFSQLEQAKVLIEKLLAMPPQH
jgi:hypothetical protein